MKYLVLAHGNAKDWQVLSKEEQDELLAQDDVLRERGDPVAAVERTVTTLRAWDGLPVTTDGAFAESRAPLAGFGIITADSLAEAVQRVTQTPCAKAGGAVEIRRIQEINMP